MHRRMTALTCVLAGALVAHRAGAQERTITFSGHEWTVKAADVPVGPGPTRFSDSTASVRVDRRGRLRLRVRPIDGVWHAAEVVSRESFGHGTYRFHLDTAVDQLDPWVVLGLFTWNDDPVHDHRELDVEFARWGNGADPTNAQFVVQPFTTPGNLVRFTQPARTPRSVQSFHWGTGGATFRSVRGRDPDPADPRRVVFEWSAPPGAVPPAGGENARINLWLFLGHPPADGRAVRVVIRRFEFVPDP